MPWHYSQSFSYTAHSLCIHCFILYNTISPISLPGQAVQYLLRYLNILFYREFFGIKTTSALPYHQRVSKITLCLSGISPDSVSRETSKDFPPDTATIQISTIFSARHLPFPCQYKSRYGLIQTLRSSSAKTAIAAMLFSMEKKCWPASVHLSIRHHTLAAQIARHKQRLPEFTSDFLKMFHVKHFSETKKQDSTKKQIQKIDGT